MIAVEMERNSADQIIKKEGHPLNSATGDPFLESSTLFFETLKENRDSTISKEMPYVLRHLDKGSLPNYFQNSLERLTVDLERHPDNPYLLNNIALVYLRLSQPDKALDCFKKAIEVKKDFIQAEINLANTYLAQGKLEEALGFYIELAKRALRNPKIFLNTAHIYFIQGDYERALNSINKVLELSPDNPIAYNMRGILHLVQRKINLAISDFRKSINSNIRFAGAYNNLGICYALQENNKKAEKYLKSALSLDITSSEATRNLATLYETQKKFADAIKILDNYMKTNEDDVESREILARAYFSSHNYRKCIGQLELILDCIEVSNAQNISKLALLYNNLGVAYLKLNDKKSAAKNFERGIGFAKENVVPFTNYAIFLQHEGDFQRAEQILRICIEIFPDNATPLLLLGRLLLIKKKYEESLVYLNKALEKRPDKSGAYLDLSNVYSEIYCDYKKSIDILRRGITYNPQDHRLTNNLAYNYLMMDDTDSAKAVLETLGEIWRNDVFLSATMGLLSLKQDNAKDAERLYNSAAQLASSKGNAELRKKVLQKMNLEFAKYYKKKSEEDTAKKYLNKVFKIKTKETSFVDQAIAIFNELVKENAQISDSSGLHDTEKIKDVDSDDLNEQIDELYVKLKDLNKRKETATEENRQELEQEIDSTFRYLRETQQRQANAEREIFDQEMHEWRESGRKLWDQIKAVRKEYGKDSDSTEPDSATTGTN